MARDTDLDWQTIGNVWCEHTDHGGCHGIHLFGTKR
jgi:hypothetical protein